MQLSRNKNKKWLLIRIILFCFLLKIATEAWSVHSEWANNADSVIMERDQPNTNFSFITLFKEELKCTSSLWAWIYKKVKFRTKSYMYLLYFYRTDQPKKTLGVKKKDTYMELFYYFWSTLCFKDSINCKLYNIL